VISVLIADDQPLIRVGFRMVLDSHADIDVIGEAGDGHEAVSQARELQPDVILMDVRMPVMNGIEATQRIVSAGISSRILILTTFDLDEYAYAALRAGASGFLLKDATPGELVSGLRAVAHGDAVVAPTLTRRLLDTFAPYLPQLGEARQPSEVERRLQRLTPREHEVLLHIAAGRSNAEIARLLVLSEATAKTHVGRILTKLELRDRVQAVVLAYENRLVHPTNSGAGRIGHPTR
jgi:DNA-binding NarL/FixJ family response regulator